MESNNFEGYLIKKKINPILFQQAEPQRYTEFARLFELIHEDSFTLQKLYLINAIRRKYSLLLNPLSPS